MAKSVGRAQRQLKKTVAAATGASSAAPSTPVRPPSSAKRRRPAFIALALLLILGSAAAAALLALHIDDRSPMLVASHDIAPGQQITRADLATKQVAADGLALIPADRVGDVVGKYASAQIPAGRLLDQAMLSSSGYLTDGKRAVGIPLQSGRVPASGLQPGDVVTIVGVAQGNPSVLAERAVVSSLSASSGSGSLVGGTDSSSGSATVIVSADQAVKVSAAAAANQVAVVLISRGQAVGG